jgi:hypothetical protein
MVNLCLIVMLLLAGNGASVKFLTASDARPIVRAERVIAHNTWISAGAVVTEREKKTVSTTAGKCIERVFVASLPRWLLLSFF